MASFADIFKAYAQSDPHKYRQTQLDPVDELKFQQQMTGSPWYREFKQNYGREPLLDEPQYDYRGAWQSGAAPTRWGPDANTLHWPGGGVVDGQVKSFKGPQHPTAWMEEYAQALGRSPTPEEIAAALRGSGSE